MFKFFCFNEIYPDFVFLLILFYKKQAYNSVKKELKKYTNHKLRYNKS